MTMIIYDHDYKDDDDDEEEDDLMMTMMTTMMVYEGFLQPILYFRLFYQPKTVSR